MVRLRLLLKKNLTPQSEIGRIGQSDLLRPSRIGYLAGLRSANLRQFSVLAKGPPLGITLPKTGGEHVKINRSNDDRSCQKWARGRVVSEAQLVDEDC